MLKKALMVIVLVLSMALAGFYIKEQREDNAALEEKNKITETIRQNETLHYNRDSERQDALNQLLNKQTDFKVEAQKDKSDDGSALSKTRVNRLNQIR